MFLNNIIFELSNNLKLIIMSVNAIFTEHGIQTKKENNNLYILDILYLNGGGIIQNWVNVSNWSEKRVFRYLGY